MNFIKDDKASVLMIPKVVYIFILLITLFFVIVSVGPVLQLVPALTPAMDTGGSIYVNIGAYYDAAVKSYYLMIGIIIAVEFVHLGLLAIRKQRYTGATNESDF